eukprot:CAMPEP_0177200786 /NCGR_PEP_ID=MMETSP0367-20130122/26407_1 /TAXON_ID=447022 ORGANISM="Scrippsiella hangoei-like, Strain SHHI-4" /NCGR_SAMPLE_ID=MMETSP0367 /ASSEMBLY_ACC=CAM_ASM_000362 /LENGTH=295 /DNA_ID=CAMNT_0018649253 /DNA_START=75 /DNA_END=962 /DNA_ORIENTATION=-
MAHKKMKGRLLGKGCSVKKSLKQARRECQVKEKGKKLKKAQPGEEAETPKAESKGTAAAASEGPKLTKKEQKAKAMMEKQHRALYSDKERILLVGEGNFSFARALCRHLGSGAGVYATCFDDEATLAKKYTDAEECRKEVEDKYGGTTLMGVDATRLHSVKEFKGAFHKIIWNFPHIGSGETDLDKSAEEHRLLLAKFFKSAAKCLNKESRGSAIHVALKTGEPYKSWKVVQMARGAAPLDLGNALPFATGAWEGYAHRRTIGFKTALSKDDSQELAKGANIYVFVRRPEEADDA